MKLRTQFFVMFLVAIIPFCIFAETTTAQDEILVTSEDVEMKDSGLEKKLLKVVKRHGTLTSARQVHSYILAVLCEYPPPGSKAKPICSFRKVKVRAHE
jgi:hypothetical protein